MPKTDLSVESTIALNNKTEMPRLGLGVYQIPNGKPTFEAVNWALDAGYRHIDTAKLYKNEESVGEAVKKSKISRKDIWVTTKLWPTDVLSPQKAFDRSLDRLRLDYVDLYLIHFPVPGVMKRTWKSLEKIYASGRCRAIGVSNFSINQMKDVQSTADVPIAVNQVRCSPFDFDQGLYDYCQEQGIVFEAYSPLTRGSQLNNEQLIKIADKYNKSTAQVLIRWCLQKNMVVIPKSSHKERIVENANVYDFSLSPEDLKILDRFSS